MEWSVFLSLFFVSRTGSFCCGHTFPFIAQPVATHLVSCQPHLAHESWHWCSYHAPLLSVQVASRGQPHAGPLIIWATVYSPVKWSWVRCFRFCLCHSRWASVTSQLTVIFWDFVLKNFLSYLTPRVNRWKDMDRQLAEEELRAVFELLGNILLSSFFFS